MSTALSRCQCPLSGFLHFYEDPDVRVTVAAQGCVNALYRAFSISTMEKLMINNVTIIVSMPFIGLSPFLQN